MVDSTDADLPPAQVVQNFLNPKRGEYSNEVKRSLESLTWSQITSNWDALLVPQGSVVIVNPFMPDVSMSSIDMELGPGTNLIYSSFQDTLLFFFESACTTADTISHISDGDTVDSSDSNSAGSGLSAELLNVVELWSGEYRGTGERSYSEYRTETGESAGAAPLDSTVTTVYNADNPIIVAMGLEDDTVFSFDTTVPGRFHKWRASMDLEHFEPEGESGRYSECCEYELGTHFSFDSIQLFLNLSINYSSWISFRRAYDGSIRGEIYSAQHFDLGHYHSKQTISFILYPRESTLVSERETGQVPNGPYLYQNAPNPFNGSTVLRYEIERVQPVKLAIYSLSGQQVVQLADAVQAPGYYELIWDGRDGDGRRLASGLYLARLHGDQVMQTRKLLLIR